MFSTVRHIFIFCLALLLISAVNPTINSIKKSPKNSLKIVCLDAGHGGKDPGCMGPKGSHEGKVTLKIILELGYENSNIETPDL